MTSISTIVGYVALGPTASMTGCAPRVALVEVADFALMGSGDPNADPAVVLLYAYMENNVLGVSPVGGAKYVCITNIVKSANSATVRKSAPII